MFDIPILLIGFNRPEQTKITLDAILNIQPTKLYVNADGPRRGRSDDIEKCIQVRNLIRNTKMECELFTNFHEVNLGCKNAVSSAIDWFFENEEMGIIIEDDCHPSKDFFYFVRELLFKFKDDKRVMHISGVNQLRRTPVIDESFYYSNHGHIWGWATWKRAWEMNDVNIFNSKIIHKETFANIFDTEKEHKKMLYLLDIIKNGKLNTWDYQWEVSRLLNNGLSINPKYNLVKNIGFTIDATNTTDVNDFRKNLVLNKMNFPLVYPKYMFRNKDLDIQYANENINQSIVFKIKRKFGLVK